MTKRDVSPGQIVASVANETFLAGAVAVPTCLQAETQEYAFYMAHAAAARLKTSWATGESGATGRSGTVEPEGAHERGHVVVPV
jgi:hypothetical protein